MLPQCQQECERGRLGAAVCVCINTHMPMRRHEVASVQLSPGQLTSAETDAPLPPTGTIEPAKASHRSVSGADQAKARR